MSPQVAGGLGIFVVVVLCIAMIHSSNRQRQQNEIRRTLIDKFGTAQDLGAFLQSEGGRRFLNELSTGAAGALQSVLGSIQKGIILVLLGGGIAGPGGVFIGQFAMGVGLMVLCTGVGFLISAVVTYWLSKSWGLLGKRSDS